MVKEIGTRITADPLVLGGKPVIKGTRVSVEFIIGQIAGGMSIQEVADEYSLAKQTLDLHWNTLRISSVCRG